jgi:hypothetical protein
MDPRTGDIYRDLTEIDKNEIESRIGRELVPITEKQAKEYEPLSKRKRKALLAGMSCPCASGKSFKKCCGKKHYKKTH